MESVASPKRRLGLFLAAFVAAAALAVWLLRPSSAPPEPAATAPGPVVAPPVLAEAVPAPLVTPPPAPVQPAASRITYTPDGVPIRPADAANDIDTVGMIPHPITPEHRRIFRENNLIGDLNGAMDVKDVAGMRLLLAQYRDEYPEDDHVMQRGYELIADCLEHPSAEVRAAAQRYYDDELDSGLRRYVRRHCLE